MDACPGYPCVDDTVHSTDECFHVCPGLVVVDWDVSITGCFHTCQSVSDDRLS